MTSRCVWPTNQDVLTMSLSESDVYRMARLARLDVTPGQAQATLAQLNDIFAMIEQMRQVDTEAVMPMAHPLGGSQRLRGDEASADIDRQANMSNAPQQAQGLFVVPRVID